MSGFSLDIYPSKLGGGLPGGQPVGGLIGGGANSGSGSGMEGGNERSRDRIVLRKAFGNHKLANAINSPLNFNGKWKTSPFRVAMNAGDILGSINEGPSPLLPSNNQVNGIGPSKLRAHSGGVKSGAAFYSGNPKYVYNGSDYTRFKKLQTKNKSYNDSSFSGNDSNSSFSAIRRVRH